MLPRGAFPHHRVKGDEHLAHEGDGGDLRQFSGRNEAAVIDAEGRFAKGGGSGCHVKGGSDRGAAAGDRARSLELATVVVERGQSDESRDGTAVQ